MSVGRWCAVIVSLSLAGQVAAQSATGSAPIASEQPVTAKPGTVHGQNGPDIVVNALLDRRRGSWKRAESEHVVVVSKASAAELTRITQNLERLHFLLSRLYRRGQQADDTVKLQVVLIDSAADFRAMGLKNLRSGEGPYVAAFSNQIYYDPREDGPLLAVARSDQVVNLNTNRAYNLDCDDALAEGAQQCTGNVPDHPPAARPWEALLYSAFAEHFIQTYNPAAYPRWYLDGIGVLFSTVGVRGNGAIDYARPPLDYKQIFRSYGDLDVGDVLAGRYLDAAPGKTGWTPYHAWLLAHFFLFSDLKPQRSMQFRAYMTAIHRGEPMAEAAKAFGDMRTLQHEVARYVEDTKSFARAGPPDRPAGGPAITTLSPADSALVEARIELGTRLAASQGDVAAAAHQPLADWLAQLRDQIAELPYDPDAVLFVAEAECRGGETSACLADADRVLARSPDEIRALAWKGVALTNQAVAGPAVDRAGTLALARKTLERAIALDGQAPLPLIAYFQSFTKAGERVPDQAVLGMARVIRSLPAAPAPRLYLAEELVRQGKVEMAQRILYTVLHGAYDSPEKTSAAALFTPAAKQESGVSG